MFKEVHIGVRDVVIRIFNIAAKDSAMLVTFEVHCDLSENLLNLVVIFNSSTLQCILNLLNLTPLHCRHSALQGVDLCITNLEILMHYYK